MGKFNDVFNDWIFDKINFQIEAIDKICDELDYDPLIWFRTQYIGRDCKDYTDTEFIKEMLSGFVWHLSQEFDKVLLKYLPPSGYNIYKEPYLSLNMDLTYNLKKGFYIRNKKGKKNFRNLIKILTIDQRQELMTDELFSYIVNKTKLKIFSKKEIRYLKLKKLNEFNKTIK